MKSLREEIEQGELEKFMAEHRGKIEDPLAFEMIIRTMADASSDTPEASTPNDPSG